MTAWLNQRETCAHLRVGKDELRRLKADTLEAGITPIWVDEPKQLFCAAKLDAWFLEVNEWRRQGRSAASGRSDGKTPTAHLGPGPVPPSARRSSSSVRSKKPKPSADAGSFVTLLRPQTSRPG